MLVFVMIQFSSCMVCLPYKRDALHPLYLQSRDIFKKMTASSNQFTNFGLHLFLLQHPVYDNPFQQRFSLTLLPMLKQTNRQLWELTIHKVVTKRQDGSKETKTAGCLDNDLFLGLALERTCEKEVSFITHEWLFQVFQINFTASIFSFLISPLRDIYFC